MQPDFHDMNTYPMISAVIVCLSNAIFGSNDGIVVPTQLPFAGIYAIELKEMYRIAYARTGFKVSSSTSSPEKLSVTYCIDGSPKPYSAEIVFANDTQWCNCSAHATHTVHSDGVPEDADSASRTNYHERYRRVEAEAVKLLPIRSPVVNNLATLAYEGLSVDEVLHVYEQAFKEAGFYGRFVKRADSSRRLWCELRPYKCDDFWLWLSFEVEGDSSTVRVIPKHSVSRPYGSLDPGKRNVCMAKFQEMDRASWNIITMRLGKFVAKRTVVSE